MLHFGLVFVKKDVPSGNVLIFTELRPLRQTYKRISFTKPPIFFQMKKFTLILACVAATAALTSCGAKRLTPEEIEAKASASFDSKKDSLTKVADEECTMKFDNLKMDAQSEMVEAAKASMVPATPVQ